MSERGFTRLRGDAAGEQRCRSGGRPAERQKLDARIRQPEPPSPYGAVCAFFVVHHKHAAVPPFNRGRIRAGHVVDPVGPLPGPGLIAADVQFRPGHPVREQDLARAQPR